MVRHPEVLRLFEDELRARELPRLSVAQGFLWLEDAYREVESLRPDALRFPSENEKLLDDPRIRLHRGMRESFKKALPPA